MRIVSHLTVVVTALFPARASARRAAVRLDPVRLAGLMTGMLGLLVALIFVAPPASADPVDDLVQRQMRLNHLPAVAVAVVDHGKPLLVRSYGTANIEWGMAATRDTPFQLASATKIVTGIVLMRLVEQGRLSLDDPLTRWFPHAPSIWSSIRVRQLANHTSGLSDDLKVSGPRTVASIVAAAQLAPLVYRPGSEARYGFTDFTVLRAIIEQATGKSLPDLVRDEVATPLGLTATRFADASEDGPVKLETIIPRRAEIYGLRGVELVASDFFFEPTGYGAGGLFSSIGDLAMLFAALDRGRVIRLSSLRELETPARLSDGSSGGFGVGWVARTYRGVPVVGHSGGPALADILRVEDRQLTIIVLTNQRTFYPLLAEAVLDLYLRNPIDPPVARDERPLVAIRLRAILNGAASPGEKRVAEPLETAFGQALLRGVGSVNGIDFLSKAVKNGCEEERVYRVRFQRQTMRWKTMVSCKGELLDLRPE